MNVKRSMAGLCLALCAGAANATFVNVSESNGEDSLQTILNNITLGGTSSIDVNLDQADPDDIWHTTDSGFANSRFVAEIAGNAGLNSFGIYDPTNPANYIELFAGGDSDGAITNFAIDADGSVYKGFTDTGIDFGTSSFGFYIGTPSSIFYSETDENANGDDQMVAYQGGQGDYLCLPGIAGCPGGGLEWTKGGWIVAFEDQQYSSSDKDFNDLVVFIESASPVPEPATLALLGLGIAGLGFSRRKQKA